MALTQIFKRSDWNLLGNCAKSSLSTLMFFYSRDIINFGDRVMAEARAIILQRQ